MTTTGRPARTARPGLRMLLLVLLGVALGVTGARYLLVGSALSLIPWGFVAALIGYTSPSRTGTTTAGAGYGFALAFTFMIAGYRGQAPVAHRLLPFALLGLLGAACATLLALAGQAIKARTRRSAP